MPTSSVTARGQAVAPSGAGESAAAGRLVSLDALRGFDMFWIIGADSLAAALREVSDAPAVRFAAQQLDHVEWDGLRFYDCIFPLFVFLSGVSIPLAFSRRMAEGESRGKMVWHLSRRFAILYLLGILFYGGLKNHWPDIRLVGVLQRIATCYLFGGLLYLSFRPRGLAVWLVAILVGYWAVLAFVPVPGGSAADYTMSGNLAAYIDRHFLPGKVWFTELGWDPEGLLSAIPAVGTSLIGILAGELLLAKAVSPAKKVAWLVAAGVCMAALGWAWQPWFPIIKKMWTSSFVLATGGISCLLLAAFYLVIDVWRLRRWAFPFVVIGSNALVIYLAAEGELVAFGDYAARLAGGNLADELGRWSAVTLVCVKMALEWGLVYWLYRRRIFVRL